MGFFVSSEPDPRFFGLHLILLMAIPTALAIYMAARLARRRFDPRLEFTDATFPEFVLESPVPVVVHFHVPWHIGNRVMETNLKALAYQLRERFPVGFIDTERNAVVRDGFPDIELPAVTVFYRGEPVWVLEGVFYEADVEDILNQIEEAEDTDFGHLMDQSEIPWDSLRKGYS